MKIGILGNNKIRIKVSSMLEATNALIPIRKRLRKSNIRDLYLNLASH